MKDEKLWYFWGSLKDPTFRGRGVEGHEKPIYRGDCLKSGAWTVCWFKGGLGNKEGGGVFERGGGRWYPNARYETTLHKRYAAHTSFSSRQGLHCYCIPWCLNSFVDLCNSLLLLEKFHGSCCQFLVFKFVEKQFHC